MRYTVKILWTMTAKMASGLDSNFLLMEKLERVRIEPAGQYITIRWTKDARAHSATYHNANVSAVFAEEES